MAIQPYSINAFALIIMSGLLFFWLKISSRNSQIFHEKATVWFIRAVGFSFLQLLFVTIIKTSYSPFIKSGQYLQTAGLLMIFYSITRFFYALRDEFVSGQNREVAIYIHLFRIACIWEFIYVAWRYWMGIRNGAVPERPFALEIPLFLLIGWALVSLMRTLLAAEKTLQHGSTKGKISLKFLLAPQHQISRFLRGILFVILWISLFIVLFVLMPEIQIPIWLPMIFDTLLLISMVNLVFVYLQFQYLPITLEFRILGAGLTLFLAFTYLLGWMQTFIYLNQVLPGVPLINIVGAPGDYNFMVAYQYKAAAMGLQQILVPLIWFELIGGTIFTLTFSVFYRTSLLPSITGILYGIDQIEKGDFDYSIPVLWQDEYGRVADAINKLATKIKKANEALLEHQQTLEARITERSIQLTQENNRRKALEVKQAIQDERHRIAEEAHDGLLQSLMGISIRLRRGPKLSLKDAKSIEAELFDLEQETQGSIRSLRQLISNLNLDLSRGEIISGIQSVIQSLEQIYSVQILTDFNYPANYFNINQELNILRIAQEGLTNACKHSQGHQLSISIQPDTNAEFLLICIEDNGVGFNQDMDYTSEYHWGINNIKNRAERLNAELMIKSTPGAGTRLILQVPLGKSINDESPPKSSKTR